MTFARVCLIINIIVAALLINRYASPALGYGPSRLTSFDILICRVLLVATVVVLAASTVLVFRTFPFALLCIRLGIAFVVVVNLALLSQDLPWVTQFDLIFVIFALEVVAWLVWLALKLGTFINLLHVGDSGAARSTRVPLAA